MTRVLMAWIGKTDIRAATGDTAAGDGPIAQALAARDFEHVVLLNNYPAGEVAAFEQWLKTLASPTHHADIHRSVTRTALRAGSEP